MPTPARRMAQGRGSGPMWASAPTISRLFEIYPAGLFLQHGLDQLRNVSTRRPPCGWPHGAPKRLFYLLGQTKFARHQGFARRAKRLYARCAPRGGVRISPQINAAGLLLQHGLDQLRDMRARRSPCGWPHGAPPSVSFICSGELNSPGIKVLPAGQNACTRDARPVEASVFHRRSMPLAFFSSMVLISSAMCAPASTAVVPWRWMLEITVRLDSGMPMWGL